MDKVSIIVPVYGVERFLPQCIESLINQTYEDLEIILVDDGSKDNSGKICEEYAKTDNRIKVHHKTNGGLTSARNYGIEHASGEWIMHVDGDDWIEPNTIERLVEKAEKKNAEVVFCNFSFDYPDKGSILPHFYDWNKNGREGLVEYISTTWTCLCGSIQKKRLYDEHRLRSPEGINYCEDFHLIVRLCFFAGKMANVSKPLYHYRQQDSSIVHTLNKKTEADEQWVYADIIDFFKNHNVYDDFKRVMAWRSLKASQELALDIRSFDEFCAYNPDKKDYIIDCPFIGNKLKAIMWCLSHGLKPLASTIVNVRKLFGR